MITARRIEATVAQVRKGTHTRFGDRLDVDSTADAMGVTYALRRMNRGLQGLTLGIDRIHINDQLSASRQRFVFAHELGHIMIRRSMVPWVAEATDEVFCDAFAYEMVLPKRWLTDDLYDIRSFIGAFVVDRATVLHRLATLNKLPSEVRISRNKVVCVRCGDRGLVRSCPCAVVRSRKDETTSFDLPGQMLFEFGPTYEVPRDSPAGQNPIP